MNEKQWNSFVRWREDFRAQCNAFRKSKELRKLQKEIAMNAGVPEYEVENAFVYNRALDDVTLTTEIKYIVVGDNPGKNEQLEKNQRYLVGQAGKLAERFFQMHTELNADFRENTIILNKSPLHTAKTIQLKQLLKLCDKRLQNDFVDSQVFSAQMAFELQQVFNCDLWIVGYSELRANKLFDIYANQITDLYADVSESKRRVYLFQHFSMNRFSIDLKQNYNAELSLSENLKQLGLKHRREILGF